MCTVTKLTRIAPEKDDFRRFSVNWEFRVTGYWVEARCIKSKNGPLTILIQFSVYITISLAFHDFLAISVEQLLMRIQFITK